MEQRADARGPEALPKSKRLAKRREFLRVYETGRKIHSRYAVLFVAGNDLAHSRIGITTTKKIGKANVRNRLKRWTRETYRRQRAPLDLDERRLDIVVNVKATAAEAEAVPGLENRFEIVCRKDDYGVARTSPFGAGDAFASAFLVAIASGAELDTAFERARLAAARTAA